MKVSDLYKDLIFLTLNIHHVINTVILIQSILEKKRIYREKFTKILLTKQYLINEDCIVD